MSIPVESMAPLSSNSPLKRLAPIDTSDSIQGIDFDSFEQANSLLQSGNDNGMFEKCY